MKMLWNWIILACVILIQGEARADLKVFAETLSQAEQTAAENSPAVKASKEIYKASEALVESSKASLYPRLTLDGTYFYQTEVPQLALGPIPSSFGDYNNYNVGPTLSYALFEGGRSMDLLKSSEAQAKSRREDLKAAVRQTLLNVRIAYFKIQLALENLELTANSLKFSQARELDIEKRFRAGASSRLDSVNAQREVLGYQLKVRQAQSDLSNGMLDLLALTSEKSDTDYSRPYPKRLRGQVPNGVEAPTVYVELDSLKNSFDWQAPLKAQPDQEHPQLRALTHAAEASRFVSSASKATLWPKIQLSARAQYMYPNGPILQTAEQNIFTVNLTMPLFEGDLSRGQAQQHLSEAESYEYQRKQKLIDLDRDWNKARDLLDSLRAQEKLSQENVAAAAIAANLTYQSYKAGKGQYLDVEAANLTSLQAQVSAAQVQAGILNTIAQLKYMSQGEGE